MSLSNPVLGSALRESSAMTGMGQIQSFQGGSQSFHGGARVQRTLPHAPVCVPRVPFQEAARMLHRMPAQPATSLPQ